MTPPGGGRPAALETNDEPEAEVLDFIRFCYRRRRVSWPEIYDDMCAVASRGSFQGWGFGDLAQRGVCFTIPDLPRLSLLVERVVDEERGRSRGHEATEAGLRVPHVMKLSGAA